MDNIKFMASWLQTVHNIWLKHICNMTTAYQRPEYALPSLSYPQYHTSVLASIPQLLIL